MNENKLNEQAEPEKDLAAGATDETETKETKQDNKPEITEEYIQKVVQSETDKVRTEYSQRLKELEKEKEALEKEKMTEEEQRQYDLDRMAKELADKESEILNRELTIKTVDLLKEKDLPLEFRDILIGADEEDTVERVEVFGAAWAQALEEAVNNRFKGGGRTVAQATGSTMSKKDIVNIQDPLKRLQKIKENEGLFKNN